MNKEPVSETKENILKEGYHIHFKASNVKMKIWKPSSTFILPRNRQSQKHQSPKRAAQKPKDNTHEQLQKGYKLEKAPKHLMIVRNPKTTNQGNFSELLAQICILIVLGYACCSNVQIPKKRTIVELWE